MTPLVDLKAQYREIRNEIGDAINGVLETCAFINGENVKAFERDFAEYCGVGECAAVGNGTDALYLALRALGVGQGDEVVTVAHTFIATAEAITLCGATPVFADIENGSMLLSPSAMEAAITSRTKALIPVHLYGGMCDMGAIMGTASKRGLAVVEDCAQSHGARWDGGLAGSFGDAGCFSFFPGKNLGAYGDAGAVVSRAGGVASRVKMLANHGRADKYIHEMEGVNSRLDEIQAAILRVKLRRLGEWTEKRRRVARLYMDALAGCDVGLPESDPLCEPVWHLFVIRVGNRDELRAKLRERDVDTGVHYPVPLHLQPAFKRLGIKEGALPVTERVVKEILSLPIYPELADSAVESIAETVRMYARPPQN